MDLGNSAVGRINRTFPLTGGGTRGSRTGGAGWNGGLSLSAVPLGLLEPRLSF